MTSIITNTAANSVVLYINKNTDIQNNLLAELSSGSRVVNPSTDPAAAAIGTKLTSDSDLLTQAASNAATLQSVLQTASGALSQVGQILTQLKSVASEALSGTQTSDSLTDLNDEYSQLTAEIADIAGSTAFNGTKLVDGSFSASVLVGTGANSTDTISVSLTTVNLTASAFTTGLGNVTTTSGATSALSGLTTAINDVASYTATVGAYQAQFQYSESVANVAQQNISAANSTLTDDDPSTTETAFNNAQVLTEAGIAALTKAEQIPQDILRLLQA